MEGELILTNDFNELSARLRELREVSDYTVEQLAEELSIDPAVYRTYEENGKDIPVSYTHLIKRRGFVRIKPYRITGSFTHFLALRVCQQRNGHGRSIFTQLAANQLCAAQHIAPLVVAAKLQVTAILLIERVEIVALHDHVIELKEGETLFHALLVALSTQHIVDGEACANLTQKLNIIQLQKPVCVVNHERLAVGEIDKAFHLALKTLRIMVDILHGQHLAHIRTAGGIADHCCTSADQRDRFVTSHLQTLHQLSLIHI